jgi:NADH-quinone oxidoreductase subunit G
MGFEPDLDLADSAAARAALAGADTVVAITSYATDALRRDADVLLPLAPFSESAGTFVNCEGRHQAFVAALKPRGEARPGWKILRVLGELLDAPGFDQDDLDAVRTELAEILEDPHRRDASLPEPQALCWPAEEGALVRIGDTPPYGTDPVVRRAAPLQARAHQPAAAAYLRASEAERLGLDGAHTVVAVQGEARARLAVVLDDRVPEGAVRIPAALSGTSGLGPAYGPLTLERA